MVETQLSPLGRFEQLLLVTDGSEFSSGAVREAIALASRCEARLHVMIVVLTNPEYEALAPQLVEKAETEATAHLAAVQAAATQAGVTCETILRHGAEVYREIVTEAEERRVDTIIMGRHGKTGLMRVMMGSVTAKVIGHSHCAVLVVPRVAQLGSKNILLAVDGSRYSDAAATAAASLAKQFQIPIVVVSVVHPYHTEERRLEAEEIVIRISGLLEKNGIAVSSQVLKGRFAETIVEAAQQQDTSLIIVGSHGRTGLEKLLVGSVSERVIGLAPRAVLVVRS